MCKKNQCKFGTKLADLHISVLVSARNLYKIPCTFFTPFTPLDIQACIFKQFLKQAERYRDSRQGLDKL